MPQIYWGHIVFVMSICLLLTLTFAITFGPQEAETTYVVAYSTNDALSNETNVNDLDFDLCAKNSFFGLCCRRGHIVSQTHVFYHYVIHQRIPIYSYFDYTCTCTFGGVTYIVVQPSVCFCVCMYVSVVCNTNPVVAMQKGDFAISL